MFVEKKIKTICLVLPTHWKAFMGGSQYQAKCLLDALVASKKFRIFYLARRVDHAYTPDGYRIQKISDDGGLRRLGFFVDSIRLMNMLKVIKPDVIYQRVACAYTGITAFYASQNACRMYWHIAHDNDVTPGKHTLSETILNMKVDKPIVEYGLKHADGVVAQTRMQSNLMKQHYGRECDAVIPNFHPDPTGEFSKNSPVKVLWVANLKPWKHPEVFVRLAKDMLAFKDVEFIMIGTPPAGSTGWKSELMRDIEAAGNLRYLGKKSQDEVNEVMAQSHIFINTSEFEGFANTFIQAWMRRVPVVSLHVNPDNVFDTNKIGCHSKNYETLVQDVKRLVSDTDLRESMGDEARAHALEHHSMKNAEQLIHLLES